MNLAFRRIRKKTKANPLVNLLIEKMNEQGVGVVEMCREAGISRDTFSMWNRTVSPNLTSLEACLNVLGYRLAIEPIPEGGQYKPVNNAHHYKIMAPTGECFEALGLTKFCKEHKLNERYLREVVAGNKTSWRGWMAQRVG